MKSDPPPAPNFTAVAQQEGEIAKDLNREQTYANRPDQTTPFGSSSWTSERVGPKGNRHTEWTQNIELDPRLQSALDSQIGVQGQRSDLAGDLMGRASNAFSQPLDWDQFGDIGKMRRRAENAMYRSDKRRLDPQFANQQNALEVKLRNQGLAPGSEAWNRAMDDQSRRETDAYAQARDRSVGAGRDETNLSAKIRQQEIAEYLQRRGTPLNEINAILSGQQVASPSMPGFQSANRAATPDLLGAASSQYNAGLDSFNIGQAQSNSAMNGMFSLGSMAMGMPI